MSFNEIGTNNHSFHDKKNKSIEDIKKINELYNKDESNNYNKILILNDSDKNNINLNDVINNSNHSSKRRKSSHSNIICTDNNNNSNKKSIISESYKSTDDNIFKDSNIVSSLKNKIKDLNNELNKLRNDSNVQNYNILEMNYKLKKKEINELRQENNFFRFNLEETKRNMETQKTNKKKGSTHKNKYILNSIKKYKNRNLLKPMNKQKQNVEEEEDDEKEDIIDNLRFENDKLRKIVKENYTLKEKIEELNKKIIELDENTKKINN